MLADFFHLVDSVRSADKWFDISRNEIVRRLHTSRKVEVLGEVEIVDLSLGITHDVSIRLKVSGNPKYSISWDMALLLHNVRIDGLGWEGGGFPDILGGGTGSGWHRHVWNPSARHADGKTCVGVFDVENFSLEDFLIWGLAELKVSYNKNDNGSLDLF